MFNIYEDFRKKLLYQMRKELKEHSPKKSFYTCHYCGDRLHNNNRTLDHIIPQSQGGSDHYTNLVFCCNECNQLRGIMPYEVFLNIVSTPQERDAYKETLNESHQSMTSIVMTWKKRYAILCGDNNEGRRNRLQYEIDRLQNEFDKVEKAFEMMQDTTQKNKLIDIGLEYYYSLMNKKDKLKTLAVQRPE